MKSILSKQQELQERFNLLGMMEDPSVLLERYDAGQVYDYIKGMQFHLNEELNELMLALGKEDRAMHKPWSSRYDRLRSNCHFTYDELDQIKAEAIDAMCFMMNIMLAAGITPDNLEAEYDKVYSKIKARQDDPSY